MSKTTFPINSVKGIQTFLKEHLKEFEKKNKGIHKPRKALKIEIDEIKNKLKSAKSTNIVDKAVLQILLSLYEPLYKWLPETETSYEILAGGADMGVEAICVSVDILFTKKINDY